MTHLINGQWLDGDAEILTKADPVSGETLWQGHAASAAQVTAACEAARDAFPAWPDARWRNGRRSLRNLPPGLRRIKRRWRKPSPVKPASRAGKR